MKTLAPSTEPARRLAPWLWIAALVVLVFVAFKPALDAEFLSWDDEANVTTNHAFRGLDAQHLAWMFTTDHMGPYQPLAWVSLAVDHALWGLGGPDQFPEAPRYHRTSVLLHALAAIAVFLLARRLLARVLARPESELAFAAFAAAAFFAVHPLRVESVAWITERRDVLCGLFYALAAWAWLGYAEAHGESRLAPGRVAAIAALSAAALAALLCAIDLSAPEALALRSGGGALLLGGAVLLAVAAFVAADGSRRAFGAYLLVLALFLCALLSKGLALVLPAVLLVLDAGPLRRARGLRGFGAALVEKLPLLVLAFLFARIAVWGQASSPSLMASWTDHTLGERVLQAFHGLAFYVRATLFPWHLSPFYDLPDRLTVAEPRFFLATAFVVLLTAALVAARRRAPGLLAAWIAYAIAIAPVLGFAQAGPQIAADRYSYLACLPFALLAGVAAARWVHPALVGVVLAALAAATFAQARVWRNSTSLWEHAIAIDPDVVMNNLNLGHARVREGERTADRAAQQARFDEAQRLFEHGLAIREHPLLHAGLALVDQHRWEVDPAHPPELAERSLASARRALELAKERNIETPEYHLNLGSALGNARHPNEALAEFQYYVRARPDAYLGHSVLGLALLQSQRHEEAARELERAVELEPAALNAWGNLGIAYEALNDREKAIQCYQRVLALAPGHPGATRRLVSLRSKISVEVVPK
ncbi:MAG TPA: tetratricopeptide repeat protein [Planctomycetota bacterium]|nr:tetratricopeptide repeat protein [Planctomycetota bacterium]